jgi:hypothetical protein
MRKFFAERFVSETELFKVGQHDGVWDAIFGELKIEPLGVVPRTCSADSPSGAGAETV